MDDQGPAPPPRTKAESGAVARSEDLNPLLPDGTKKRILTGDRTTGKLHLGHYVGSLKNRVRLQGVYDTFILMADVQALTTHYDRPEVLKQSVWDVALDYMAVGLEPYTGGADDGSKAKIVIQSMVPAIAELTVYYGLLVPISFLQRNPTVKSEAEQLGILLDPDEVVRTLSQQDAPEAYYALRARLQQTYAEVGIVPIDVIVKATESVVSADDVSLQQELVSAMKAAHLPADWKDHDSGYRLLGLRDSVDQAGRSYREVFIDPALVQALTDLWEDLPTFRRALREQVLRLAREAGLRQLNYGFLGYPISQAADITFVGAHLVPVGEDQVPHIELTREIVRRFNSQYGGGSEILTLPQALIGGGTVKGLDGGAKMSKSLDNAIYLSDDYPEIWRRVSRAVTDPQRVRRHDPGRPEICNIFAYHELFNDSTEPAIAAANLSVPSVDETAELCRTAGIGCVECKKNLAAKLDAFLSPMRERREAWAKRPDDLRDVLQAGTKRGIEEGEKTLERVQQAMHLDYFT